MKQLAEKIQAGEVSPGEGFEMMANTQEMINQHSRLIHGLFNIIIYLIKKDYVFTDAIKEILKDISDESKKELIKEKLLALEKHKPNLDWINKWLKSKSKTSID